MARRFWFELCEISAMALFVGMVIIWAQILSS
jgi:hypothetical protein